MSLLLRDCSIALVSLCSVVAGPAFGAVTAVDGEANAIATIHVGEPLAPEVADRESDEATREGPLRRLKARAVAKLAPDARSSMKVRARWSGPAAGRVAFTADARSELPSPNPIHSLGSSGRLLYRFEADPDHTHLLLSYAFSGSGTLDIALDGVDIELDGGDEGDASGTVALELQARDLPHTLILSYSGPTFLFGGGHRTKLDVNWRIVTGALVARRWSLEGATVATLDEAGKARARDVPGILDFGPNAALGLSAGEFHLLVATSGGALRVRGRYSLSKSGEPIFEIDERDLAGRPESLLDLLPAPLPPGFRVTVEIEKGRLVGRVRERKEVERIRINLLVEASLRVLGIGVDERLPLLFRYVASGRPADP